MVKVGIIGGSGLDDPNLLEAARKIEADTPFGKPSSPLTVGKMKGVDVVILARHGIKHSIMPTNVPFQANIYALKEQGCTHIIATTACGSLRGNIKPGDFVFVDQFIDRTTKRKSTFHDKDKVCHISMAEPFCGKLRKLLAETAKEMHLSFHEKGTVVTIEGPRFSTKAESHLFRSWNADVINMSTVPEAVLAREAAICYATIAMNTDYDCWLESEEAVTWEMIVKTMKRNADNVKKLLFALVPKIGHKECSCRDAIKTAIV
ncbi:S-methyl-5'-thioadenosine phosphorylase [Candidatus Woesearchaeota archaeon]|nr:S-methyl-5'-thioadenosine phosphorylase [Candidatus Woesearchaeota archaeon]